MSDAIAHVERLLADAEQLVDARARGLAKALAAAMVDLVGDGMRRVIELGGGDLARQLADDDLVGSLFVLCGLHPDAPLVRAERALAAAGHELGSIGVRFDGVTAEGDALRVRLIAERAGAEPDRVRELVEAIVVSRAPDAEVIVVELGGAVIAPAGFVPIERLRVST